MSIYQEVLGRFISRAEALRIAREILEQAERERLVIAEYEAEKKKLASLNFEPQDYENRISEIAERLGI